MKNNDMNKSTDDEFTPAWWLANPHLQTVWSTFWNNGFDTPPVRRERFELSDGDFVDLDWVGGSIGPRVLILHGLAGSIESPYAKRILQTLHNNGWRGIFMHFRGCSGEPNRLARSYHSGDTGDVAEVVQALKAREPHSPIYAVGYSLGGNVLLKWLGETGADNVLQGAVAISVPFQLHHAASRLQQGFSQIYQWWLLRGLHHDLLDKFKTMPSPIDLDELPKWRTFWEFDDKVTAPLHGFNDANDYYQQASCHPYLPKIIVPTLVLHALDDPFLTPEVIPKPHELSSAITLEVYPQGGHVGFIGGSTFGKPYYWLEPRILKFLEGEGG